MSAQADATAARNVATYFLDRNLSEGRGGRTALIDGTRRCTYAELAELTNQVGNALLELGVHSQDRVLLALADSVEFVATWYAAQKIGAVTAEVYTFLQPKDYAYYVDYTGATVVVVDGVTVERMRTAMQTSREHPILLVIGVDRPQLRDAEAHFESIVARQPRDLAAASTTSDSIAIWKFTTGSTGRPKACVHTARSPLVSYNAYARGVLDIREDDVVLPVPKLFFGYARDLAALFPFGVGATGLLFSERATAELIFELIARHRPTILVNVPTMMQAMLDHPSAAGQDLSCLRICTSAGEALPEPPIAAGTMRSAWRCSTASARPRRITSTSRIDPAGRDRAASVRSSPATAPRWSTTRVRRCPTARSAGSGSAGRARRSCTGETRTLRRAPSPATWS